MAKAPIEHTLLAAGLAAGIAGGGGLILTAPSTQIFDAPLSETIEGLGPWLGREDRTLPPQTASFDDLIVSVRNSEGPQGFKIFSLRATLPGAPGLDLSAESVDWYALRDRLLTTLEAEVGDMSWIDVEGDALAALESALADASGGQVTVDRVLFQQARR